MSGRPRVRETDLRAECGDHPVRRCFEITDYLLSGNAHGNGMQACIDGLVLRSPRPPRDALGNRKTLRSFCSENTCPSR
jgi:hypothetical protein